LRPRVAAAAARALSAAPAPDAAGAALQQQATKKSFARAPFRLRDD
jgi:hypothetical protein